MPLRRLSSNRAPASGSEPISMRVYGCRGSWTIALAAPFSTSLPAYMTMIVSAIWYRIARSWVITIVLFTNPRSLNSTSISETAFCVETSSAEVSSSAIEQRGIEERREHHHDALLHAAGELDREAVEDVVGEPDEGEPPLQLGQLVLVGDAAGSEELVDQPPDLARRVERAQRVLRDQRHLAEAEAVHARVVVDRQLRPVELDATADVLHPAVEADEALRERRLAAARTPRPARRSRRPRP